MALLGPMVVVTQTSAADLVDVLSEAGAFPIVETSWANAPAAIVEVQPVAVAITDTGGAAASGHLRALARSIETRAGPVTPVFMLVETDNPATVPGALPTTRDDWPDRFIARLSSALRIRTLHATVLRRARAMDPPKQIVLPADLLADATVLCVGRGGSYPALSVAIGERVSLIGAFSIETAARYLNARDIDGVVIGEGLGARAVDALIAALVEDSRFRDLPIGLLNRSADDESRLPNLMSVAGNALRLVERILPFVRLRAFESHLKRLLKSLESDGFIDPHTGLLESHAFWRDLDRAVGEAEDSGSALSIARFSFEGISDARAHTDAARLFSRLVRTVDFACREQDGSILAAFTATDLRSAHVVARRIASTLKQTMLSPGHDRRTIKPSITLATFKPTDNLSTLVARVGAYPKAGVAH
jgi:GGDEF domain-containing protein